MSALKPLDPNRRFEPVVFRLIVTPCCSHQLCWVNPRSPNFCPECGERLGKEKTRAASVFVDNEAFLQYNLPKGG